MSNLIIYRLDMSIFVKYGWSIKKTSYPYPLDVHVANMENEQQYKPLFCLLNMYKKVFQDHGEDVLLSRKIMVTHKIIIFVKTLKGLKRRP
jgi:hypothetical protein